MLLVQLMVKGRHYQMHSIVPHVRTHGQLALKSHLRPQCSPNTANLLWKVVHARALYYPIFVHAGEKRLNSWLFEASLGAVFGWHLHLEVEAIPSMH